MTRTDRLILVYLLSLLIPVWWFLFRDLSQTGDFWGLKHWPDPLAALFYGGFYVATPVLALCSLYHAWIFWRDSGADWKKFFATLALAPSLAVLVISFVKLWPMIENPFK